jgi:hypothetical protein
MSCGIALHDGYAHLHRCDLRDVNAKLAAAESRIAEAREIMEHLCGSLWSMESVLERAEKWLASNPGKETK